MKHKLANVKVHVRVSLQNQLHEEVTVWSQKTGYVAFIEGDLDIQIRSPAVANKVLGAAFSAVNNDDMVQELAAELQVKAEK